MMSGSSDQNFHFTAIVASILPRRRRGCAII
jgi:hypothetical protein